MSMVIEKGLLRRAAVWTALAVLLAASLACALPGLGSQANEPTATPEEAATEAAPPTATFTPEAEPTFTPTPTEEPAAGLEAGEITGVRSSGSGITGRGILEVEVTNPENETITFVLPPGFVFLPPPGSDEQRMMVLQEERIQIGPGETVKLDPFVACIDASAGAPGSGSSYTAGGMVDDEQLQALAVCLAEQDLSSGGDMFGFLGLQFAVWRISDGYSTDEISGLLGGEGGGALGDVLPPETMELMLPLLEQMGGGAQTYLDACGLD